MKYVSPDKYSGLKSIIHHLDARIKIISFFSFILFVILTPPTEFIKFCFYFILIFSIIILSKVPLKFILKRTLIIIPFVLLSALFIPFLKQGEIMGSYSFGSIEFAVTYSGALIFFNIIVKSWLSVLATITLISTTPFPKIIKGFEKLKMPRSMLMIISFMYRYIFVIVDEALRLKTAYESRNTGKIGIKRTIKAIGNIIGVLYIRSYERGERVYFAMLSRGFTGQIKTMHDSKIKFQDVLFASIIFTILTIISIY